jgi:hypothetical protein
MRKFAMVSMLMLISFYVSAQDNWKTYQFDELKFKIDLVQEPTFSKDSSLFENEYIYSNSWEINVVDTLHDNAYYGVEMVGYPSKFIHSDSLLTTVEGFINSTQNSLLNDEGFELLSSRLVEKQGYPGKVFRWVSKESQMHLDFHVYLVESRLFTLSVVAKEGKNHNISINKFVDSFDLIHLPKGSFKLPQVELKQTYTIQFPGKAVNQSRTVDSEIGKLPILINILEIADATDNKVYVAMETKYPKQVASQEDVNNLNKFYKRAIDKSLQAISGELVSIADTYYKGKLGKEYRAYFMEGKALVIYRIFYINENVYSFGVITLPDKDNNEKMKEFFNSFHVNNL